MAVPVPEKVQTNEEAKVLLQKTFSDSPVMIEIARCESRFHQWGQNGEVLRGVMNPKDRGLYQINEFYHLETSQRLGYDIYSAEGNIAYAKALYQEQGTAPWKSSADCWDK